MFVNKTLEYKRFSRRREGNFIPLSTAEIRGSLESIGEEISRLSIKQKKHCLPSFTSKRKRQDEIEEIKRRISNEISATERKIEDILGRPGSKTLASSMYGYFIRQLRTAVYRYRSLQQEFLKKVDFYEDLESREDENEDNIMMLENVKDIRRSIYDLTTVLLDMKMAVGQQSIQIDRLDFYLDSINFHLEGTNRELEKMPGSYRGVKDRVMYFLLCLSILLVAMSMLKMLRHRR